MIQSLIFFPDPHYPEYPRDHDLVSQDISLPTPDGKAQLFGWFIEAENPKGIVIYFHGNAGNISGRLFKAKGWVERGFSFLLYDYRSYGKSTGTIQSDEQMVEDAKLVVEWAKKKGQPLIFYGESLGTHLAIRLAVEQKQVTQKGTGLDHDLDLSPFVKPAAVILEAPYTSFTDLAPVHYPWIPKPMVEAMLKHFSFPNMDFVGKVRAPIFILHGTQDLTCPFYMGEKIYEEAMDPKELWTISGGGHSDLPALTGKDYWDHPIRFLSKHFPS